MTPAEEKVREISDKLVHRIDELREEGYTDESILATVRNYLIGITDGIDFAEEMRNQDAVSVERVAEIYSDKTKPTSQFKPLTELADSIKEMQDQHQKEMKAFANEWMNNGYQEPLEPDQDIT